MWGSYVDYEARKGYAVGPSLERCQEVLNKLHLDGPEFMIDRASFRVSRVDVWRPKYYKTLRDGWKIDFNLVRCERLA